MKQYLELLDDVISHGVQKGDRTGTGTLSVFGRQLRFDLSQGFPAVTTKKLFWKGVVGELLWFLRGSTNVKELQEQGIHIWDAWADADGELGPVYGRNWRNWQALRIHEISGSMVSGDLYWIDQIAQVIQTLKTNPDSRRMLVSAWNVADLPKMALEPCHALFQFYVTPGGDCDDCWEGRTLAEGCRCLSCWEDSCEACQGTGKAKAKLSCQLYQRSADLFLGVPFNIASYALLTHMVAQVCDLDVGEFIHTFGDAHIYSNHVDQVKEQLRRACMKPPTLWLNPRIKNIDDFTFDDIELRDYHCHPPIRGDVAV